MLRTVARVLGIVVALLAVAGFFVEGDHLFGLMNVDITLDVLRVVIAVALLYVGFGRASASAVRTVIIIVGAMYVLMGLLAFADSTLFGILPTGFTGFDIAFHLIVGLGSLVLAFLPVGRKADTGR
jgi:hypothetical protein